MGSDSPVLQQTTPGRGTIADLLRELRRVLALVVPMLLSLGAETKAQPLLPFEVLASRGDVVIHAEQSEILIQIRSLSTTQGGRLILRPHTSLGERKVRVEFVGFRALESFVGRTSNLELSCGRHLSLGPAGPLRCATRGGRQDWQPFADPGLSDPGRANRPSFVLPQPMCQTPGQTVSLEWVDALTR
jgi:hypothetical protein